MRTFVISFYYGSGSRNKNTVPVPQHCRQRPPPVCLKPDGEGRVAVGELEEGTAAMLEHITAAALPLVDLLAGAPHPLVVGEGFGGLDEGGAVGGAHVGRQVLQPRGLQVLALRHVQAVLAVLHT